MSSSSSNDTSLSNKRKGDGEYQINSRKYQIAEPEKK